MDGLLLQVDIKKPFRVVRPDEEGLDLRTQFCANYRLKWARHQARLLFRHGGGA